MGERAIRIGDISIGSRDTCNVGAVLPLPIIVVGRIVVTINIVVCKGLLAVDVSRLRIHRSVQLICNRSNLFCIQQIQAGLVRIQIHTGLTRQISQRILKASGRETLVVGIRTGIDDGDTGASAGVARSPGCSRTDLLARGSHIGISRASVHHVGQILGLDHNALNTGDLFDGLDLAVGHIGRNDICCQGQIPDNVQILFCCLLDLRNHIGLLFFQLRTVVHCCSILRNAHSAVASFDRRSLL